jgi:hypothetical protein
MTEYEGDRYHKKSQTNPQIKSHKWEKKSKNSSISILREKLKNKYK